MIFKRQPGAMHKTFRRCSKVVHQFYEKSPKQFCTSRPGVIQTSSRSYAKVAHQICERRPQAIQTSSERYAQLVHKFNKSRLKLFQSPSRSYALIARRLSTGRPKVMHTSLNSYCEGLSTFIGTSSNSYAQIVHYAKGVKKFPSIVLTLCTNRPGLF